MSTLIILVHVIVCIALIFVVLLQTGKGADMGAAFGGGSSQTVFGNTGASSFLSKMTTGAAIVFMLTSLTLAYVSNRRVGGSSVMPETDPAPITQEQTLPEVPPDSPMESGGVNEPVPSAPVSPPTDSGAQTTPADTAKAPGEQG
jgi:preprotein translocase subunit SecG